MNYLVLPNLNGQKIYKLFFYVKYMLNNLNCESETYSHRKYLENLISQSKNERQASLKNMAKYSILPLVTLGGIGVTGALVTSPIEDSGLRHMASCAMGLILGSVFYNLKGSRDYIEKIFDSRRDFKFHGRNLKHYSVELSKLE